MSKQLNSDARLILFAFGILACLMFFFWAAGNQDRAFAPKMTRLTLTAPGCVYLQEQTGISVHKTAGGNCEVDVRFVENRIGSGGVIRYGQDDENRLQISESQVIGWASIPEPVRPWTSEQKYSTFWMVTAVGMFAAIIFFMFWDGHCQSKKNESGTSIKKLKGLLRRPMSPITIEAMNEAIAQAAGRKEKCLSGIPMEVIVRLAKEATQKVAMKARLLRETEALRKAMMEAGQESSQALNVLDACIAELQSRRKDPKK